MAGALDVKSVLMAVCSVLHGFERTGRRAQQALPTSALAHDRSGIARCSCTCPCGAVDLQVMVAPSEGMPRCGLRAPPLGRVPSETYKAH